METKPLLIGPNVKQFRLINTSLEGLGIIQGTEVRFNDKEFEYIRGFFNYFNLRNCLVSTTDIIRESIKEFPDNWEEIKI